MSIPLKSVASLKYTNKKHYTYLKISLSTKKHMKFLMTAFKAYLFYTHTWQSKAHIGKGTEKWNRWSYHTQACLCASPPLITTVFLKKTQQKSLSKIQIS